MVDILVKKKGSQKSTMMDPVNDYLVWYGRSPRESGKLKMKHLYEERAWDSDTLGEFNMVELPNGDRFNLTRARTPDGETFDYRLSPARLKVDFPDARIFRPWPITNGGIRANQMDTVVCKGQSFTPPSNRCWSFRSKKIGPESTPMECLGYSNRLIAGRSALDGVRYHSDFPFKTITNWWDGLGGASDPVYVVQTNEQIVQRCLLMVTDPGDLVMDITCGSGTTAIVAEGGGAAGSPATPPALRSR